MTNHDAQLLSYGGGICFGLVFIFQHDAPSFRTAVFLARACNQSYQEKLAASRLLGSVPPISSPPKTGVAAAAPAEVPTSSSLSTSVFFAYDSR